MMKLNVINEIRNRYEKKDNSNENKKRFRNLFIFVNLLTDITVHNSFIESLFDVVIVYAMGTSNM